MIELDCALLRSKRSIKLRFSSDDYGHVVLDKQVGWVALDRGIALRILDKVKTRSVISDGLTWFYFRAYTLGQWAHSVHLGQDIVTQIVTDNPSMVCKSWAELEAEHSHRNDFKRHKRPLVAFSSGGPRLGMVWEFYPELERVGVYLGDSNLLFFDRAQCDFLL